MMILLVEMKKDPRWEGKKREGKRNTSIEVTRNKDVTFYVVSTSEITSHLKSAGQ